MAKSSSNTKAKINPKGLGIFALASIVVSSMLGGGIYSLPQNMAAGASAGAANGRAGAVFVAVSNLLQSITK